MKKRGVAVRQTDGFEKITPINGFDATNPDNAKQNNYAWSMNELGGNLYVGTGRNIVYSVLKSGQLGNVPIPPVFVPEHVDMNAEIWQHPLGETGAWTRVYKAPSELGITGIRIMVRHTTPSGETALYGGCSTLRPGVVVLKSVNGIDWVPLATGIEQANSTRAMVVHEGRLYLGALGTGSSGQILTLLYTSTDPEREGWQQIDLAGDPLRNPRGAIVTMSSFNGHLYVGTALAGGFEVWRSEGAEPRTDEWKLIVDKGAGDALNQIPLSMGILDGQLYVGSAIQYGILGLQPGPKYVPPKGFDLIRIAPDDRWELVVGGAPVQPAEPTTGTRGEAISGEPSGFGNLANVYCWQLQEYRNELYLGTIDLSVAVPPFLPELGELFPYNLSNYLQVLKDYAVFILDTDPVYALLPLGSLVNQYSDKFRELLRENFGFDLFRTRNATKWSLVSRNGLDNPYNYGARNLFAASDGNLYLGTANPFQGCEVWIRKG